MRALWAGQDHFRFAWRGGGRRQQAHLDALVSHKLQTGAPVFSAAGVAPEQRGRTHLERMQKHADLARLCSGVAIPLARLSQPTGTTTANAGAIHHAQAPIGFWAVFMRGELLISGAPQRSIGLESKVLAREAARFPGQAHVRRSIPRGGSCVRERRRERRNKLGDAYGSRLQLMSQLQAEIPNPLGHQLPALLSPG